MAGIIEAAYFSAGLHPHDVLWKIPLTMVGWLIAVNLRRQGVKGVGRRIDFKRLKAAVDAAKGEA
jgi:hypothetical protein